MALIKKIKTSDGVEHQIDYNALANLPDISSSLSFDNVMFDKRSPFIYTELEEGVCFFNDHYKVNALKNKFIRFYDINTGELVWETTDYSATGGGYTNYPFRGGDDELVILGEYWNGQYGLLNIFNPSTKTYCIGPRYYTESEDGSSEAVPMYYGGKRDGYCYVSYCDYWNTGNIFIRTLDMSTMTLTGTKTVSTSSKLRSTYLRNIPQSNGYAYYLYTTSSSGSYRIDLDTLDLDTGVVTTKTNIITVSSSSTAYCGIVWIDYEIGDICFYITRTTSGGTAYRDTYIYNTKTGNTSLLNQSAIDITVTLRYKFHIGEDKTVYSYGSSYTWIVNNNNFNDKEVLPFSIDFNYSYNPFSLKKMVVDPNAGYIPCNLNGQLLSIKDYSILNYLAIKWPGGGESSGTLFCYHDGHYWALGGRESGGTGSSPGRIYAEGIVTLVPAYDSSETGRYYVRYLGKSLRLAYPILGIEEG